MLQRRANQVTKSRSARSRRDSLPHRAAPLVIAVVLALTSGSALARGGHGGGHGGGGHGGGHGHAGGGHSSGASGAVHYGGRYGGRLALSGPTWGAGAHWGNGFWAWNGMAWVASSGRWWVSPAYPGWVWMGAPWVWDGQEWAEQDGYWTTADVPQGQPPPSPSDVPSESPPPPPED